MISMISLLAVVAAASLPLSSNQTPQLTADPIQSPSPSPTQRQKGRTLAALRSAITSVADEDDAQLMEELFDSHSFSQKNINPNFTMPIMPHTVKELQYASKNYWFGPRNELTKHGIGFSATYTGAIVSNPVGGIHPGGCDYYDIIALTSIISTQELLGWHGGHFIMSAVQQDGGYTRLLSPSNIGNEFGVNSGCKGYTFKWVNLYYQQLFCNDRCDLNIGRFSAMDEFDVSPVLWNYIGSLQASPTNFQTTWSPNASWASRLKIRATDDIDLRFGIFQLTTDSVNGLTWNFYPNDGISLLSQISWNPQFGKPGASSIFDSEKKEPVATSGTTKTTQSQKSFSTPVDLSKLQKLPGHYFAGGFYNTSGSHQFNDSWLPVEYNNYGFFCHADQLVYRPNPTTDAGLTLWSEASYTPQSPGNTAVISYQIKGGSIYTGLIPGRRNDFTIFGLGYGRFSSSYQSLDMSSNIGDPTFEMISELGYRINFTRFIYIQPDIQFIINPGGTGHIPDALVLGTMAGIVF